MFNRIAPTASIQLNRCLCLFLAAACSQLLVSVIAKAEIIGLGDFAGGAHESLAYGISDDGSVVVGFGTNSNGNAAFRWTRDGGLQSLFGDGNEPSIAGDVSADGSVIVGSNLRRGEAFRWTASTGFEWVGSGTLGYGVSGDGSTVVGFGGAAYRWTRSQGIQGLGSIPGGVAVDSYATGASSDGRTVVGVGFVPHHSDEFLNIEQAFRWTESGGMEGLGDLLGGGRGSYAFAVSDDGSIVVGSSISPEGQQAFRWTQDGGMQGLGDLPGGLFSSSAHAVSADGMTIGGEGHGANGREAFLFTDAEGMRSLSDVLIGQGDTLSGWQSLIRVDSISADGKYLAGHGINSQGNTEAFFASLNVTSIPEPSSALALAIVTACGLVRRNNRDLG